MIQSTTTTSILLIALVNALGCGGRAHALFPPDAAGLDQYAGSAEVGSIDAAGVDGEDETARGCPPLSAPGNGSVSDPDLTAGSTARYGCAAGYGPAGSSTRTCQPDGTWSGVDPTCILADCPALAEPPGGTVSAPALRLGSVATYSCDAGYLLVGSVTRVCQGGGWSGAAAKCAPVDCGDPIAPTNGSVSTPTTTFNSIASDSCKGGYDLSGAASRVCQENGKWSADVPICIPKDCGGLPTRIENGSVSALATTFGATASYACDAGFATAPAATTATRLCQADGKWSSPVPSCSDICTLGSKGTPTHCCDVTVCPANKPVCGIDRICGAIGLGQPCTDASACGSGSCVAKAAGTGKVCCATGCSGACDTNTCDGTGQCLHKAARSLCGTRAGSNTDEGNDIPLICDDHGTCAGPIISCTGTGPCDLTTSFCCNRKTAGQIVFGCSSVPCGTAVDLGLGQTGENCKSTSHCPLGQVCELKLNYGFRWTECTATLDQYQVCALSSQDCLSGTCTADTNLNQYLCE